MNPLYRKLHAQISWITETWYIQYNTGLTYSTLSLFTTVVSLPQEIIAQIAGKSYLGGYNWFLFFIFFYFVPVPFRCVFYFCSVAINCFTVSGLTYSTLSLFTTSSLPQVWRTRPSPCSPRLCTWSPPSTSMAGNWMQSLVRLWCCGTFSSWRLPACTNWMSLGTSTLPNAVVHIKLWRL